MGTDGFTVQPQLTSGCATCTGPARQIPNYLKHQRPTPARAISSIKNYLWFKNILGTKWPGHASRDWDRDRSALVDDDGAGGFAFQRGLEIELGADHRFAAPLSARLDPGPQLSGGAAAGDGVGESVSSSATDCGRNVVAGGGTVRAGDSDLRPAGPGRSSAGGGVDRAVSVLVGLSDPVDLSTEPDCFAGPRFGGI